MADDVPFLTVREFIEKHHGKMSESLVTSQVRKGLLPHVRMGRRIYIPENGLELMLEQQQAQLRQRAGAA